MAVSVVAISVGSTIRRKMRRSVSPMAKMTGIVLSMPMMAAPIVRRKIVPAVPVMPVPVMDVIAMMPSKLRTVAAIAVVSAGEVVPMAIVAMTMPSKLLSVTVMARPMLDKALAVISAAAPSRAPAMMATMARVKPISVTILSADLVTAPVRALIGCLCDVRPNLGIRSAIGARYFFFDLLVRTKTCQAKRGP